MAQSKRACRTPCAGLMVGVALMVSGCEPASAGTATEVISRVELRFTPQTGQDEIVVAVFDDPDGDGGMSGIFDDIILSQGVTYDLRITFVNGLEDPPIDVTREIEAEAEEHLVLIYGDVDGPASTLDFPLVAHDYDDTESDYGQQSDSDLPVGLRNVVAAGTAGSGEFSVMLRHLPALNDTAQKLEDLPARFAAGEDIPGNADVDLQFMLIVE